MANKNSKNVNRAPDACYTADFSSLYDQILGNGKGVRDRQQLTEAVDKMPLQDIVSFCAYIALRKNQLGEIESILSSSLTKRDVSEFPSDSSLFSVKDAATGKMIGGLLVETTVTKSRSTKSQSVSLEVKEALKKANLFNTTYIKTSEELKNDALFKAKEDNVLPASVANLLKETETKDRVVKFVPIKAEEESK